MVAFRRCSRDRHLDTRNGSSSASYFCGITYGLCRRGLRGIYCLLVRVDKGSVLVCACCARIGVVSALIYERDNVSENVSMLSLDNCPVLPEHRGLFKTARPDCW